MSQRDVELLSQNLVALTTRFEALTREVYSLKASVTKLSAKYQAAKVVGAFALGLLVALGAKSPALILQLIGVAP